MNTMLQTIEGVWLFVLRITETAPIGAWALLLSIAVPALTIQWMYRNLPETWHPASRGFIVETIALALGILLTWLPWQTLQGVLVGIVGGLASPYVTKGFMAMMGVLFRRWMKHLGDES